MVALLHERTLTVGIWGRAEPPKQPVLHAEEDPLNDSQAVVHKDIVEDNTPSTKTGSDDMVKENALLKQ